MRIWSIHPRYLDPRGLVALWREALLAQAVLEGQTRGYRNHPQLLRFRDAPSPAGCIAAYLRLVHAEALRRGYRFDAGRIRGDDAGVTLSVTRGQLAWEWAHLIRKVQERSPAWLADIRSIELPEPHPLFHAIEGDVADWEAAARGDRQSAQPAAPATAAPVSSRRIRKPKSLPS